MQEILVDVIERIYSGSMVKFELESIMTAWCKSDSGVRQGCPLSPLLFNIYVRELGIKLVQCKQGFEYLMVNKDGVIEKSQAGFLYTDDVCLMAGNEQHLPNIFDNISGCIQWLGREKSQRANGPMLTQINGPFQISMGHGIKCMGHQWVSISKTCIGRKQDKRNINVIL